MMEIQENIPLREFTTFRTGGPARFLLTAHNARDVREAVAFAENKGLLLIPLGSGSNMVAPDAGLDAVLLRYVPNAVHAEEGIEGIISADAGLLWDSLVALVVESNWWGAENLSAIPGTVGAAVVQNIGAYGVALSEIVAQVEVFDTNAKNFMTFSNAACAFGYRTSIFKKEKDRYIITKVTFRFSTTARPRLEYKDVAAYFTQNADEPTVARIREAVILIRQKKFPPLTEYGTAGSFFLNPIITEAESSAVHERFPGMPLFKLPEGGVKVPLAWILDHVLSLKGERTGKAFLWEAQPLVIAAERGASAEDVVMLATKVARAVHDATNIVIVPEVRLFGAEKKIGA